MHSPQARFVYYSFDEEAHSAEFIAYERPPYIRPVPFKPKPPRLYSELEPSSASIILRLYRHQPPIFFKAGAAP